MKILYKSDDGMIFDNEFDCIDHEWRLKHDKSIRLIEFYDKEGNIIDDKLSENSYNTVQTIVVPTIEALNTLRQIAEYTGFCNYFDVEDIGKWQWDDKENKYMKV